MKPLLSLIAVLALCACLPLVAFSQDTPADASFGTEPPAAQPLTKTFKYNGLSDSDHRNWVYEKSRQAMPVQDEPSSADYLDNGAVNPGAVATPRPDAESSFGVGFLTGQSKQDSIPYESANANGGMTPTRALLDNSAERSPDFMRSLHSGMPKSPAEKGLSPLWKQAPVEKMRYFKDGNEYFGTGDDYGFYK